MFTKHQKTTSQENKTTILRFYPFTKGVRHQFLSSAIYMGISVAFTYLVPQVIKITIDSILDDLPFALPDPLVQFIEAHGGQTWLRENFIVCAMAVLLISATAYLCDFLSRYNLARACETTLKRIRDTLFSHIQRLPYDWHNRNQTGDIIQRCTMDTEMIRTFLSDQLLPIVRTVALIVIAICLMIPMHLTLSLVALGFIPITLAYSMIFYRLTAAKFQLADQCEGELTSLVQENLTGVRVVRAFGRESYELDRFLKKNDDFVALWIKLSHILGLNWGLGDLISLSQFVVVGVLGAWFAVQGEITSGEFVTFVSYNSMLIWPIRNLGHILSELSKTTISSIRLFDILDAVQEQDCPSPTTKPVQGDICFSHVNFSYLKDVPTLQDVSFRIPQGTTLGILGATGSGKSTLTYLLDRLYELPPENGKITIGGVDIRDFSLADLRSNIGIVLQEPFLFSKSFTENISDGAQSKTLPDVRAAARLAFIDDTITGFAHGYDTQIGERGVTISGGQKQRVAIARMLMQNTPIKIFDDSLSAVDMETDAKIRASINQNVTGTTIIIAHRITTIMNADQIIVLEKGKLVQHGTHNDLIAQDGIYKKIYDTQKAEKATNFDERNLAD